MTWGLVLSGGAAWGIANGGVVEVLEREGLRPDCIAGSSMGAIVGALFALGLGPETLRSLCEDIRMTNIATLSERPLKGGLLHGGLLRHRLEERLAHLIGPDTRIADCRIPFVCVVGRVKEPVRWERIVRGGFVEHVEACIEPYVFPPDTPLIQAIVASSAIPVLFSPVTIDGTEFIDLVHFGAIPARTIRAQFHPDAVIATDTCARHEEWRPFLPRGWKDFLDAGHRELEQSRSVCDLIVKPSLSGNPFRFDKAADFYDEGKRAAEQSLPAIRALLS